MYASPPHTCCPPYSMLTKSSGAHTFPPTCSSSIPGFYSPCHLAALYSPSSTLPKPSPSSPDSWMFPLALCPNPRSGRAPTGPSPPAFFTAPSLGLPLQSVPTYSRRSFLSQNWLCPCMLTPLPWCPRTLGRGAAVRESFLQEVTFGRSPEGGRSRRWSPLLFPAGTHKDCPPEPCCPAQKLDADIPLPLARTGTTIPPVGIPPRSSRREVWRQWCLSSELGSHCV